MKRFIEKVKQNYIGFNQCAVKNDALVSKKQYIQYLYYYKWYNVSMNDYFFNKLYDKTKSHKDFWEKNHKKIHKWKNVVENYKPNAKWHWRTLHFCDYVISKVFYPGLDAMDYFRYEFYNIKHCKRKTYITEGYLRKMNRIFNDEKKHMMEFRLLQDKAKFNQFFSDVVTRKWMATKEMKREEFDIFCEGLERVIAKPKDGCQGKGIFITSISLEQERNILFDELKSKDYILEEIIVQCEEIAKLNPRAVNSIRVYSVAQYDDVVVTCATLRLGSGCSDTDNYSAGGFAASIDVETGLVVSHAISQYGMGTYVHPVTGQTIIGTKIPQWEKVLDTVKYAHRKISNLRYIGWDVVVCADETVTFLEANTSAGVALQQHPSLEGKKQLYLSLMKK